ncbi:MAG: exodeoxyribonuclease VII small subunit [bacterium]|nr:exodeoxyribonuclease VII small subunit [bacterium]
MAISKEKSFKEHLKEIAGILEWFDAQEELDVEEALAKVEQAADLIKRSRARLAEIENTFTEVKRKVGDEK